MTWKRAEVHRRRRVGLAVAALVAILMLVLPSSVAGAGATVSVTPSEGLVDGQQVSVTYSGATPGSVSIRQCPTAGLTTNLNTRCVSIGTTSTSSGSGSANANVRSGQVGGFRCDSQNPCFLYVTRFGNTDANAGWAQIQFAAVVPTTTTTTSTTTTTTTPTTTTEPRPPCPAPTDLLVGFGDDSGNPAMLLWSEIVCLDPISIPLDFTQNNAANGREAILSDSTDFALTTVPFTDEELAQYKEAHPDRDLIQVPLLATAVVCPFNVVFQTPNATQSRLVDLWLSSPSVARLLNASTIELHEPPVSTDNIGNTGYPPPGVVARVKDVSSWSRADPAGSSYALSSWFYSTPEGKTAWEAEETWTNGAFKTGITERFPNAGQPQRTGAYPLADALVGGVDSIACLESSIAAAKTSPLPLAQLRGPDGSFLSPSVENVQAALRRMTLDEETGTYSYNFQPVTPPPPGAATNDDEAYVAPYVLPQVTYLVAPNRGLSEAKTEWLTELVTFALTDGQTKYLPGGYVPFPPEILEVAEAQAAKLGAPPLPATTTTTSPGATTTSAPGSATTFFSSGAGGTPTFTPIYDSFGNSVVGGGGLDGGSGFTDTGTGTDTGAGSGSGGAAAGDGGGPAGGGGDGGNGADGGVVARAVQFVRTLASSDAMPIWIIGALAVIGLAAGPTMQWMARRRAAPVPAAVETVAPDEPGGSS